MLLALLMAPATRSARTREHMNLLYGSGQHDTCDGPTGLDRAGVGRQLRKLQSLVEIGVDRNTTEGVSAPLMSAIWELGSFLPARLPLRTICALRHQRDDPGGPDP